MTGDLHTHSNFSDGSTNINELAFLAARANLTHLAISDHDTELSIKYAQNNAVVNGVKLIPAVELTCMDEERKQRVHMLCYYPAITKELKNFFELMAQRRNEATGKSIEVIEKMYPQFTREAVKKLSQNAGVTFKAHIGRVLFELGYTDGVYKELYKQLLNTKTGTAFFALQYVSLADVLKIVKKTNAITVLAHPSVYNSMQLAQELARNGQIDGVEINHPRNTEQDKIELVKLAKEYSLLTTGGSDFHGIHMARANPLGSYTTCDEELNKLENLYQKRKINKNRGQD